MSSDIQLMKTKRANKVAQKRLKLAQLYMKSGERNKFYAETLKAMWGYLSVKLGIPVSELNKENIESELLKYGMAQESISDVMDILNKCEFAQYTPELSGNDMNSIFSATCDVMNKLENTKRK